MVLLTVCMHDLMSCRKCHWPCELARSVLRSYS